MLYEGARGQTSIIELEPVSKLICARSEAKSSTHVMSRELLASTAADVGSLFR